MQIELTKEEMVTILSVLDKEAAKLGRAIDRITMLEYKYKISSGQYIQRASNVERIEILSALIMRLVNIHKDNQ